MPIARHPSPSTEFRMPWCKNGRFAFRTSVHATQNGRLACRMSITISRIVFWSFWAPQPFIPAWRKNPSLLHCRFLYYWYINTSSNKLAWRMSKDPSPSFTHPSLRFLSMNQRDRGSSEGVKDFFKFIFEKSAICHKLRLTFSFIIRCLVADTSFICHYLPLICHSKCYMRINKLACLWQSGR